MSVSPPLSGKLEFDGPWPAVSPTEGEEPVELLGHKEDLGRISLLRLPGERLRLQVWKPDGTLSCNYETQPFRVDGPADILLSVSWIGNHAHISIDGTELKPKHPNESQLVISALPEEFPLIAAWDHPDARTVCSRWIRDRHAKFAAPPRPHRNRRGKKPEEQARDLRTASMNLHHLAAQAMSGKVHLGGHLATELRAMVHWEKDTERDNGYNPVLLRLANMGDLPLPVFARPEPPSPAPQDKMLYRIIGNPPELYQTSRKQQLMDLQDWLLTTAVSEVDAATGTVKTLSVKELISETANVLGPAHYDEDIATGVDIMQNMVSAHVDYLVRFLSGVSDFVKFQSDWVLDQLNKQGKLS